MQYCSRLWVTWMMFFVLAAPSLQAQEADSLKKYEEPPIDTVGKVPFYKSKVFKASIVPAILIGYGVSTIGDHGIYSSYDAKRDLQHNFSNFSTSIDDALLIAPYVELAVVNLLKIPSNNDFINTSLLILKAEAIMAVTVFGLKSITNEERPNGEDFQSMPSGHTAQAFLAASIVHSELRSKSQWYGVGAYAIATSVGAFRMLNNKHWQSDVFVGAGIGILSAHIAYLTHRNRWGRKPFVVGATYRYGTPGIGLTINIDDLYHRNRPTPEYQQELEMAAGF